MKCDVLKASNFTQVSARTEDAEAYPQSPCEANQDSDEFVADELQTESTTRSRS